MLRTRFSLLALTLVAGTTLALSGCNLGSDANVGGDTQNSKGDQDASSSGGASSSTGGHSAGNHGGSPGSAGGSVGGAVNSGGGHVSSSGGTVGAGGSPATGPLCGNNICPSGQYCCNSSCGMCAPMGAACIQIACDPTPPATDAGPGTCVNAVPCPSNTTWSTKTCECVPNAKCSTDADCHLVDNYCGGCNCLSLTKDQKVPACAGQEVQCFAAPCMNQTAACVNGACVAKR